MPDSAWGHFAKAQLVADSDPQLAKKELQAAIALDPESAEPYESLLSIEDRTLNDVNGAIEVAETMSSHSALARRALPSLWRLRLLKAARSDEARRTLRLTLQRASGSNDIRVLDAVRVTYAELLDDNEAARSVEKRIVELDPSWYPARGRVTFFGP